jgi:hypothetical protein
MQCAQSHDRFGYASLRSAEVTGGTKMKAQIESIRAPTRVTAPEPQPTHSITICPVVLSSGNPRKPHRALPAARAVTEPLEQDHRGTKGRESM